MTFAKIIGPKYTKHYEASTFGFTNQKPPKIKLYLIILVRTKKKNLNCFEKWGKNQPILDYFEGERSKVVQFGQQ